MRVREASGVIERGHERGGRDRPDARDGLQPLDAFVGPRHGGDPLVRVRELLVDLAHDGEQGGEFRPQPAGQRQGEDAADEALGTASRHAPAMLPEQGGITLMYPVRVRTRASRTVRRPRTWRWVSESRWAGR